MGSYEKLMIDEVWLPDAKAEVSQNLVNRMHSCLSTVNIQVSNPPN